MLILTRRPSEAIMINDGIKVVILGVKGTQVRVGVDAPKDVSVHREEIYNRIQKEGNTKEAVRSSLTVKLGTDTYEVSEDVYSKIKELVEVA